MAARTSADGDALIGYGGISRLGRTPPFEYEIHTIGVDPAYQGRGIGRRLLDELLKIADGAVVHLEVRTDNEPAIALYRSVGFAEVGLRRRYYRISGADAYTMRREALDIGIATSWPSKPPATRPVSASPGSTGTAP